jgi:hypothetical protein
MTLTNKASREAAGKINEDVDLHDKPNGQYAETIARGQNVRLPSGQILSPEAQIMLDKSIVARNFATPAFEEIRIKNLSFRYFWGNYSGANGRRYQQLRTMGWTNATLDDVEPMAADIVKEQGSIRYGDLILMKLPMGKWMEREKAKIQKAINLGKRTRTHFAESPNPDVRSDSNPTLVDAKDASAGDGKYLTHFTPTEAELTAKMGVDQAEAGGK